MVRRSGSRGRAPVAELASSSGAAAWRLALMAGANCPAATAAAVQALVTAAAGGGAAAELPAILARSRSEALARPGGPRLAPVAGPVVSAFWSLPEPLRSTLWCTDALGLSAAEVERVVGAGPGAAAVARGRLRRSVCRPRRGALAGTDCASAADVLGKVLTGHGSAPQAALVSGHADDCSECSQLLASLRDPVALVAGTLPPVPDLEDAARRSWQAQVGEARQPPPGRVRRAADTVGRHHRPVAAVLAVLTAGSLGSATSQLAASTEGAVPPGPMALAAPPEPPAARARRPAPYIPQAVIPPLAGEAVVDPALARFVTRDLAEATPVPPPPAPPPAPAPTLPAPAPVVEPPPAVDLSTTVDGALPLPVPVPFSIELGPACPTIRLGFLRVTLPCQR